MGIARPSESDHIWMRSSSWGVQLQRAQEWFAEGNWNRGAVGVTVASAECVMTDESGVLVATATSTLLISDVKPA
jgi:hypothetical protein